MSGSLKMSTERPPHKHAICVGTDSQNLAKKMCQTFVLMTPERVVNLLLFKTKSQATARTLSLRHLLRRDSGADSDTMLTAHSGVRPDGSFKIHPKVPAPKRQASNIV